MILWLFGTECIVTQLYHIQATGESDKMLKSDFYFPKKNFFICFSESPLKMMKMLFSFSRYLNFSLDFLFMQKKQLDQKDKVNFKIYDVTTWFHIITKHILPNISRSKSNQIMKIDQVIENNNRNIFLQKSCRK